MGFNSGFKGLIVLPNDHSLFLIANTGYDETNLHHKPSALEMAISLQGISSVMCIFSMHAATRCNIQNCISHMLPVSVQRMVVNAFNPLNAELNPICYLLALLGAHHFLHVSRIRVKVD